MNLILKTKHGKKINKALDWLLYMTGYGLIMMVVALVIGKPHFSFSEEHFYIWPFLSAVIIYLLNKTIKPILFRLTLPITGITLGLFYPFINVFILYLTSFIMLDKFVVEGIFTMFFIAILISIMNFFLEEVIIKAIIRKGDKNE